MAEPGRAGFLVGGGEMGALMRAHDWTRTPMSDPARWPQSLRSAVSIMLNSRYPIALYWGPDLALLYNDAWSPIPGGKHPWALGRPGRAVWPEIWDTIGPLFDTVITTGEGVWQEDELLLMLRHGYREECYYNFTFSPVRGEDGAIDGIFNAVVETTDRVLSERRLRTLSRMGERASASLTVEGACRWATDILAENSADVPFALTYLRVDGEARLVAARSLEPGTPAAPGRIALDAEGGPWPLREAAAARALVIAAPDGHGLTSAFWSEPITDVVITPIMLAGEPSPAAFLVAGANPRRRVDAAYRSFFEIAAGHLGTALATARAYEDERRRARALAEIDRAKTTFFSNVSHEFRTPLTLMLGPLEDALAAAESPEQRERLDIAHRNALRLLRLVNALLDFSRIEAGRVEARFRPTDLAALTAELASGFRAATDRAGLRLTVQAPPLSGPVHVDPEMWEKIVLNLVSNAFKFTHRGGIMVALREEAGEAVLTVRDTGTGIPAAELPRLFDRFHRVEGSQGRSFEGSGIGLALVKELVAHHGGRIAVESEEGEGTTFTVGVPLGVAHLPADRVHAAAGTSAGKTRTQAFVEEALRWLPGEAASNGALGASPVAFGDPSASVAPAQFGASARPARVLLADDNADLRDYTARLLGQAGYAVATAPDGEAALAALEAERPDLLLTDIMMPRLDGFALLRQVRARETLRDLPVIMLSARAGEEAQVEGLDAGADDYLIKPFSARELLARVAANIRLARLRREAMEAVRASERRLRDLNATLETCVAEALAGKRLFADLIEATDTSAQVIDPFFRLMAINQAGQRDYERAFGIRPEVGDVILDVLASLPDERAEARRLWDRALAGETFTEVRWWGGEGREHRAYETRFSPLRDGEGRRIGAYALGQDVTERLREQERLAAAEDQLRQAQKMEAVGQLTGGIAHDFNNLLGAVLGGFDLIRRRPDDPVRVRRIAENGMAAAERGARLTSQLLAFSRAQKIDRTPIILADVVGGMRELLEHTLGPGARVRYDLDRARVPVLSDAVQIEMAVLNLAINARDAMPAGGELRIETMIRRIEADPELGSGEFVELAVSDTGTGMPPEVAARAFDPFFTTKGVGKGTGLGLSQVYGIARQAGGTARIRSSPGRGTTVSLLLPRTEREPVPPASADPPQATDPSPAATVLVIDDDHHLRRMLAESLDTLGYRVMEAADGPAALAMLGASRADQVPEPDPTPDLVIVDFAMPGMNGAEVAEAIRSRHPALPIVFASGYADTAVIERAATNATAMLRKPFDIDELQAVVRELLERRS